MCSTLEVPIPGRLRLRMISRLENLSAQFLMVIIALLLAVLRQNLILIDSVAFLASDRTLLA